MTEEKRARIAEVSRVCHLAREAYFAAGMQNTCGLPSDELLTFSIGYDLLKAEWLEARKALDEAMKP